MNVEGQYLELLRDIINNGVRKNDRTGTGTISVFGRTLRHNMRHGFPLLTTKRLSFHNIKHELLWFLKGDTNIKSLLENGVHIWTADAYRAYKKADYEAYERLAAIPTIDVQPYEPLTIEEFENQILVNSKFAERFGSLGPSYGLQWREWASEGLGIDQISNLVNDLKTNPDSRRLIVTAWNPGEISQVVLPPCHHMFQCWTRELSVQERLNYVHDMLKVVRPDMTMEMIRRDVEIELDKLPFDMIKTDEDTHAEITYLFGEIPERELSLQWNQRSVDTFLGLPYNLASYALLLQMLADEVNMVPGELIGNLADTHIYSNHIEQVKTQLGRIPYDLPKLGKTVGLESTAADLQVINYTSHQAIKAPLSVG